MRGSLHQFITREAASTGALKDKPTEPQVRYLRQVAGGRSSAGSMSRAGGLVGTVRVCVSKGWLTPEGAITPAGMLAAGLRSEAEGKAAP